MLATNESTTHIGAHLSAATAPGRVWWPTSAQQQRFDAGSPLVGWMTRPCPPGRVCGVFFGSLRAIATKSSLTFVAVFADVSMKKMPLSLA